MGGKGRGFPIPFGVPAYAGMTVEDGKDGKDGKEVREGRLRDAGMTVRTVKRGGKDG